MKCLPMVGLVKKAGSSPRPTYLGGRQTEHGPYPALAARSDFGIFLFFNADTLLYPPFLTAVSLLVSLSLRQPISGRDTYASRETYF